MSESIQSSAAKKMMLPTVFDPYSIKRRFLDLQYGTLACQQLDLYLPDEGDGPFPVLLYVHGGGWTVGSRRECALNMILGVLKHGWAIAVPDYRLAQQAKFPEFIYDVKTSIRFLRSNAAKYGLAADKTVILGDSAGGHIALTVGFTNGRPEYEGGQYGWEGYSSAVQGIVDMYGIADFTADEDAWCRDSGLERRTYAPEGVKSIYDYVLGTDNKSLQGLLSPVNMVHGDIPPVFLQHGRDDCLVPYQHSETLLEKIEKVCGPGRCELRLYPGRGHADPEFEKSENSMELMEFLAKI